MAPIDLEKFKNTAKLKNRYEKQLQRLKSNGIDTQFVEKAVNESTTNLGIAGNASIVIYGEPQSGKTEMMICLTAKLLDNGNPIVVHLMNDSVDLLMQNLKRFKESGLAPAPISSSELPDDGGQVPKEVVVFCKKNAKDLNNLIQWLKKKKGKVVVIDDEADYATPNAAVNKGTKTTINNLVGALKGPQGYYIGVTATPARLNLNNTMQNDSSKWVRFPPHAQYTGQDVFFPLDKKVPYRLTLLDQGGSPQEMRNAFIRFLVTVSYLNSFENKTETNYTMMVHTSGKKIDHEADRSLIEKLVDTLSDGDSKDFPALVTEIHKAAEKLYPSVDPDKLTEYVVSNASRATLVVLNSERDRMIGESATVPSSPFTVIIGGNIISRGVTLPNLLSMFFTRTVRTKLQQDTYIQRARMFGSRGKYLKHFELSIPSLLYAEWHRCFAFHRLALDTVGTNLGSPVWIGDKRISVASDSSIDKATVALDKGEMSFGAFDFSLELDDLVSKDQTSIETLKALRAKIGSDALPPFLIEFIAAVSPDGPHSLAIHTSSAIEGYGASANKEAISRDKGFMGKPQLEANKFPKAIHHIKVFRNAKNKAKVFYKYLGSVQFIQNLK